MKSQGGHFHFITKQHAKKYRVQLIEYIHVHIG
jgi:hypothetical protein